MEMTTTTTIMKMKIIISMTMKFFKPIPNGRRNTEKEK